MPSPRPPAAAVFPLLRQLLHHRNPWIRATGIVTAVVLVLVAPNLLKESAPKTPPTYDPPSASTASPRTGRRLETLTDVTWVSQRSHDGDSFHVRAGERTFELRLYFVDCPESYLSQEHTRQRERVADQARDLGLEMAETVALGKIAKARVAELLRRGPLTVHTRWERVYDGERFYGFVEFPDPERPGKSSDLAEWLVREGLARIHTKGETLPNGRSAADYERFLRSVEAEARQRGVGAWRPR